MNAVRYHYLYFMTSSIIIVRPALTAQSEGKRVICEELHRKNSRSMLSHLFAEICNFPTVVHTIIFDMLRTRLCEVATINNAHKEIRALVLLSDRRCASLGGDSIKIWNMNSGTCERTLTFKQPDLACDLVAWSPHRMMTHSGTLKHRMVMYDLLTKSYQKIFPAIEIVSLVPISNNRIAFSQLNRASVDICDVVANNSALRSSPLTLKKIWCLKGHNGQVKSLEALPNDLLVAATGNWTIKIWSTKSGECIKMFLSPHASGIVACRFLMPKILASYTDEGSIKLWNIASGTHEEDVSTICEWEQNQKYNCRNDITQFSRQKHCSCSMCQRSFFAGKNSFQSFAGKYLVALSRGHARILNPKTRKFVQTLNTDNAIMIGDRCQQLVGSCNQLVVGTETGDIILYEMFG